MIRDVVSFLDYSDCAEISLTIFVVVFVAVTLRALLTSRATASRMASIPLEDPALAPALFSQGASDANRSSASASGLPTNKSGRAK